MTMMYDPCAPVPYEDGCPHCGGNAETNGWDWWCEGHDPLPPETDEDLQYDPRSFGCGWADLEVCREAP
jgi:hypothetical protein